MFEMFGSSVAMPAPLAMVDVGMNLLKILAVAGGATVGAVSGGLLLRLIAKMSFGRKANGPPLRIFQALGATGMGVVVYFWAFGPGGSGIGGDGGSLGGKTQNTSLSTDLDGGQAKPETAKTAPTQEKTANEPAVLRIELLGGLRVKGDRFYRVDGEKDAKNLAELRELIRSRQNNAKPSLERIEIVIYEDSVAPDHPAVRDLEKWAKQNNLTVSIWKPAGLTP